jgi:hypothetical protein
LRFVHIGHTNGLLLHPPERIRLSNCVD